MTPSLQKPVMCQEYSNDPELTDEVKSENVRPMLKNMYWLYTEFLLWGQ